jgi:molybdate transport system substrate-binding protein
MKQQKSKIRAQKFFINFLILFFCTTHSFASNSRNLTIFAEPSMSLALTKISRLYSQKSDVIISANFNSSADLTSDIDSGEPADVFISAHPAWIETLHQKGLVDVYNVGFVAKDSLVLVTLKSNPNLPAELKQKNISLEKALKILNQNNATLILDYEGNSSGKFSNDLIKNLELFNLQIFRKLAEDKSPLFYNIKKDSTHYALLLSSQVKDDPDFQILAIKKDLGIFYRALVIAGDNMDVAREFLKFLKTDAAKKILLQSGFGES